MESIMKSDNPIKKIIMFPVTFAVLSVVLYVLSKDQIDLTDPKNRGIVGIYIAMAVLVLIGTIVRIMKAVSERADKHVFYIGKYWEKSIGGSDEAMLFIDYLAAKDKPVLAVRDILEETGINRLNGNLRHVEDSVALPLGGGMEAAEVHYPIEIVTVLAALMLECRVSGSVNYNDLDSTREKKELKLFYGAEELKKVKEMLSDYVRNPKEYDIYELMLEDEAKEVLAGVSSLLGEL